MCTSKAMFSPSRSQSSQRTSHWALLACSIRFLSTCFLSCNWHLRSGNSYLPCNESSRRGNARYISTLTITGADMRIKKQSY